MIGSFARRHTRAYAAVMPLAAPVSLPRNLAVLAVFIAGIIWMAFFNWTHRVRPDQQAVVHGQLVEWSELSASKGGRTPRFTISEH
jgi:hypothetical protein